MMHVCIIDLYEIGTYCVIFKLRQLKPNCLNLFELIEFQLRVTHVQFNVN